jgi:DNA-binding LytR/AlgR family response regulator
MFRVALCGLPGGMERIRERIDCVITEYTDIVCLTADDTCFDVYLLNNAMRDNQDSILKHIETVNAANISNGKLYCVLTYINDPITDSDLSRLTESMAMYAGMRPAHPTVELLTDQGRQHIDMSRIRTIEYAHRKVKIKTMEEEYTCGFSLRHVASLTDGGTFAQPHKSFLVNMRHITNIKNYTITMNDGSMIPLSQKKSREFRKAYKSYVKGGG